MSGHSKWATIKRKKAANDAKRSNQFAKLLRAVEVAAKEGGGDPASNMTLASAVEKARASSVPSDNIDRAIRRGSGADADAAKYEEITYEGYAPGGIALFIETLTDNRNRTAQDVRHAFTRNGGNLGETGSTGWMFTRKGVIVVDKSAAPDQQARGGPAADARPAGQKQNQKHWG
jgi:YebC/PmpR family DNA-binding regulatory protein